MAELEADARDCHEQTERCGSNWKGLVLVVRGDYARSVDDVRR